MTTVFDTILDTQSNPIVGMFVGIQLVGSPGDGPGGSNIISVSTVRTDANGYWTADLTPNGSISPAGTVYKIKYRATDPFAISVPASGSHDVDTLRTAMPGAIPSTIDAANVTYEPAVRSDWGGTPPATDAQALDLVAAGGIGGGSALTFDIANYGYTYGSGDDAQTAILTAFAAMQAANDGTHASGVLRLSGPTDILTATVLDGGVASAATPASSSWSQNPPAAFTLECAGAINAHAGLGGPALSIKGFINPVLRLRLREGGAYRRVTDGTATSSSSTVGSTTAAFTSADNGRYVRVEGAGYAGGEAPFDGVFTDVDGTSGTVATYTAANSVTGATLSIMDIAVHVENCFKPDIDIVANNYAGLVLHMDSANLDTSKQVIGVDIRQLHTANCGQSIAWHHQGSAGRIDDVDDLNSSCGALFQTVSDVILTSWDQFCPATQNYGFTAVNANNWSVDTLSLGDRPSGGLVKFVAGDVGAIRLIRASGIPGTVIGSATVDGITLVDLNSIEISIARTFRCAKGIRIKGGGAAALGSIVISRHQSLTSDTIPVYIEGGPTTLTAPCVKIINGSWRNHYNQTLYVASSVATDGSGRVPQILIGGLTDGCNFAADASAYAIDCQSTTAQIDISGWTLNKRNVLAGAVYHFAPSLILGAHKADIQNELLESNMRIEVRNTDQGSVHGNRYIAWKYNHPLTANRTFTLQRANSLPGGSVVTIADEGAITGGFTITAVAQTVSGDTLYGDSVISASYGSIRFVSDGHNKWYGYALGRQDLSGYATTAALTSEATTRASADTALASSITSEASTRANADTTNANAITSEASTARAAESANAASIALYMHANYR